MPQILSTWFVHSPLWNIFCANEIYSKQWPLPMFCDKMLCRLNYANWCLTVLEIELFSHHKKYFTLCLELGRFQMAKKYKISDQQNLKFHWKICGILDLKISLLILKTITVKSQIESVFEQSPDSNSILIIRLEI